MRKVTNITSSSCRVRAQTCRRRQLVLDITTKRPNNDQRVFLHPSSVNFNTTDYDCPYLVYNTIQFSSAADKFLVYDCSVTTAYALCLFAGRKLIVDVDDNLITLDGWIKFRVASRVGTLLKQLRHHLDRLLAAKVDRPSLSVSSTTSPVLDAITRIISTNGV